MPRLLVPLALVFALASPAHAQEPVQGALRIGARPGETMQVDGLGALRGTAELRRTPAGITLVNELHLEDYLLHIREVPGSWPVEALKAQVVAARTYALWEKLAGKRRAQGFDVCPTVACQVFMPDQPLTEPEQVEARKRWAVAVKATAGEVLLHNGRPALTRYHASSGGHTVSNHIAYPGSADFPYLRGVADPTDAVSPLHRWAVDLPLDVIDALLRPDLKYAGALKAVRPEGRSLVLEAEDGTFTVDAGRLRVVLNERAPAMFPGRYPPLRSDGKPMPLTMPSGRFDLSPSGTGISVSGRGYGHGVGMGQWGAMGWAKRGASYRQILGHYYGGLQPQPWTGDRTIRVGLDPVSSFRATGTLTDSPGGAARPGTWDVRPGPGSTLLVTRPPVPTPPPTPVPTPVPSVAPVASPEEVVVDTAAAGSPVPLVPRRPVPLALAVLMLAVSASAASKRPS